MPITKHEAAQLRGYISHHMQAVKAQQHGCSIGLTQDELRTRAESARSDLYKFILKLTEQNSVDTKPSADFLETAQHCGAELTGKPDGSEPVTVMFTCEAWRAFDAAVNPATPHGCACFGRDPADGPCEVCTIHAENERLRAELNQVNEWRAAALAENQALGESWASRVGKAEARVAQLERFAANTHPDTKLLDFLTSRASINFDDENCLLRFEVPSTFEGANSLREIIAAAKGEADRDDAEANGEANG